MLKNLLNTKVVQVVEQVKDWREAVAISCRPLIENGSIEPRYVDAIYHSHDTIGPYYVVGPGIAMPHAVLTPESWTVKHEAYRSDSDIQLESDLLISG
ncbi:PTS sugar transporter subunit IIA, partial [Escherichia coli]|nr:PTS sugar transporter subunit IIA [Escherichia coli]